MKKLEVITGIIATLGIILKLINIVGASILIVLSLTTLSVLYCFFGLLIFNNIKLRDAFKKISYEHTNSNKISGAIGIGWACSIILIGMLYKLQMWPKANIYLISGLIIMVFIMVIGALFYTRSEVGYYETILKRAVIILSVGFALFLIPTTSLVDIYYRDNIAYRDAYKKAIKNPGNAQALAEVEKLKLEMLTNEFRENNSEETNTFISEKNKLDTLSIVGQWIHLYDVKANGERISPENVINIDTLTFSINNKFQKNNGSIREYATWKMDIDKQTITYKDIEWFYSKAGQRFQTYKESITDSVEYINSDTLKIFVVNRLPGEDPIIYRTQYYYKKKKL